MGEKRDIFVGRTMAWTSTVRGGMSVSSLDRSLCCLFLSVVGAFSGIEWSPRRILSGRLSGLCLLLRPVNYGQCGWLKIINSSIKQGSIKLTMMANNQNIHLQPLYWVRNPPMMGPTAGPDTEPRI